MKKNCVLMPTNTSYSFYLNPFYKIKTLVCHNNPKWCTDEIMLTTGALIMILTSTFCSVPGVACMQGWSFVKKKNQLSLVYANHENAHVAAVSSGISQPAEHICFRTKEANTDLLCLHGAQMFPAVETVSAYFVSRTLPVWSNGTELAVAVVVPRFKQERQSPAH